MIGGAMGEGCGIGLGIKGGGITGFGTGVGKGGTACLGIAGCGCAIGRFDGIEELGAGILDAGEEAGLETKGVDPAEEAELKGEFAGGTEV